MVLASLIITFFGLQFYRQGALRLAINDLVLLFGAMVVFAPYLLFHLTTSIHISWIFTEYLMLFFICIYFGIGQVNIKETTKPININNPYRLMLAVYLFGLLVFLTVVYQMSASYGIAPWEVTKLGLLNAIARYSGEIVLPGQSKLYQCAFYSCFCLASFLNLKSKKQLFLFIVLFITVILESVVFAARAGFLLYLLIYFCCFLIQKIVLFEQIIISKSALIRSFVLLLLFVVFFTGIQFVRIKNAGSVDPMFMAKKLLGYFVGYMPTLEHWFWRNAARHDYSMGTELILGPLNFLGLAERNLGVYSETVDYELGIGNIHTSLRGIISGFGLFSGLLFGIVLGYLFRIGNELFQLEKRYIGLLFMLAFLMFLFYFPIISPFTYVIIVLSLALSAFFIKRLLVYG